MNVDIAYRLSRIRRDRGLSQEELAEKLGVSRQAVSKWERAESSPDTDNLIALAGIYDMSLDELLTGSPEDMENTPDSQPKSDDGGDHVHISFRDGINVEDKKGAKVHIGLSGIHVDDPGEDAHVHIGADGVNVHDGEGNDIHSDPDGGYVFNDTHYDDWQDAHEAVRHQEKHKCWMHRVPYWILALVAFLGLGIFANMWPVGLVVLFSTAIWYTLASLVDAFSNHRSARKRRSSVTTLVGTTFLYAFFVVGFLFDLWHPGWLLIVAGLLVCSIINSVWKINGTKKDSAAATAASEPVVDVEPVIGTEPATGHDSVADTKPAADAEPVADVKHAADKTEAPTDAEPTTKDTTGAEASAD